MKQTVPDEIVAFAQMCDKHDLHGLSFQHVALCERRAWLHMKRIDYSHLDSSMQRGQAMHEVYRPRDRSVEGLFGLAPDRVDWANRIVTEAKGGPGARDAVSKQTAFYALMLWAKTGKEWRASNDIIPQKRTREVKIDSRLISEMVRDVQKLVDLKNSADVPEAKRLKICDRCSYRFFCGFS